MTKVDTTSKMSLELTTRMNLGRRGARAKLSFLAIVHKPLHSLERVNSIFWNFLKMKIFWSFLKLLKELIAWSQGKLKNKSFWSIFVWLWLKFPEESGWKIKHNVPYWGTFRRGKETSFSWNVVTFSRREFSTTKIFPNENFSRWKKFPAKHNFLGGN